MRSEQQCALRSIGLFLMAFVVVGAPVLVMCKFAFGLNGDLSCVVASLAMWPASVVCAQAVRHKRSASPSDRTSYKSTHSLEDHREK